MPAVPEQDEDEKQARGWLTPAEREADGVPVTDDMRALHQAHRAATLAREHGVAGGGAWEAHFHTMWSLMYRHPEGHPAHIGTDKAWTRECIGGAAAALREAPEFEDVLLDLVEVLHARSA